MGNVGVIYVSRANCAVQPRAAIRKRSARRRKARNGLVKAIGVVICEGRAQVGTTEDSNAGAGDATCKTDALQSMHVDGQGIARALGDVQSRKNCDSEALAEAAQGLVRSRLGQEQR